MKVIILAGGKGTRLAEETTIKPKPMVEIGDYPILWHIMKGYSQFNFKEFYLALGYKGELIKDYFVRYHPVNSDITIDLSSGNVNYYKTHKSDWKVHLIDTGGETLTGGRLQRLMPYIANTGTFMLTYGDGVSNININDLVKFHKSHKKLVTLSAVRPPARFGTMVFDGNQVVEFKEKPQTGEGWINGGFYVMEPGVFEYLRGDKTVLELDPLEQLAKDGELMAYKHDGFWQCMDTLRDKLRLDNLWEANKAPWKTWE